MPSYRPFNTPTLYLAPMRLILLLSALLSAFAAGVLPARADVSVAQVHALTAVEAVRAAGTTARQRPVFVMPSVSDLAIAPIVTAVTALLAAPLYAGRLRI